MTRVVISQPLYYPWPGFFELMSQADIFIHLDDVQFSRGSFTNRIQLKYSSGSKWMTIPIVGGGAFIQIRRLAAADVFWQQAHKTMVCQALRDAPFLHEAVSLLDVPSDTKSLCDLLIMGMENSASKLGIRPQGGYIRSSTMGVPGSSWQRVLRLVKEVGGSCYITAHGAANYLDHMAFEECGVAVQYVQYSYSKWPQLHGDFTPFVSVLDLIANVGDEARNYIKSLSLPWREHLQRRNVT